MTTFKPIYHSCDWCNREAETLLSDHSDCTPMGCAGETLRLCSSCLEGTDFAHDCVVHRLMREE